MSDVVTPRLIAHRSLRPRHTISGQLGTAVRFGSIDRQVVSKVQTELALVIADTSALYPARSRIDSDRRPTDDRNSSRQFARTGAGHAARPRHRSPRRSVPKSRKRVRSSPATKRCPFSTTNTPGRERIRGPTVRCGQHCSRAASAARAIAPMISTNLARSAGPNFLNSQPSGSSDPSRPQLMPRCVATARSMSPPIGMPPAASISVNNAVVTAAKTRVSVTRVARSAGQRIAQPAVSLENLVPPWLDLGLALL